MDHKTAAASTFSSKDSFAKKLCLGIVAGCRRQYLGQSRPKRPEVKDNLFHDLNVRKTTPILGWSTQSNTHSQ